MVKMAVACVLLSGSCAPFQCRATAAATEAERVHRLRAHAHVHGGGCHHPADALRAGACDRGMGVATVMALAGPWQWAASFL